MSVPIKCSLCSDPMIAMPITTPASRAMVVTFCRRCDRRRCGNCAHHEQDTSARKCSACGERF